MSTKTFNTNSYSNKKQIEAMPQIYFENDWSNLAKTVVRNEIISLLLDAMTNEFEDMDLLVKDQKFHNNNNNSNNNDDDDDELIGKTSYPQNSLGLCFTNFFQDLRTEEKRIELLSKGQIEK
ncbi:hypothetical protein G9A89_002188 [Geosiphon pyriformis]|nr:hypothetical protein G9A89_002188 [Geosiphon pyriformis]